MVANRWPPLALVAWMSSFRAATRSTSSSPHECVTELTRTGTATADNAT